jgi:hypothetical protein
MSAAAGAGTGDSMSAATGRLEQGAKYIDLVDPDRRECTATGDIHVRPGAYYVPKHEVDYVLWNRLIGVTNPELLDQGNGR